MNVIITFVWVILRNKNHAYFFVLKENRQIQEVSVTQFWYFFLRGKHNRVIIHIDEERDVNNYIFYFLIYG